MEREFGDEEKIQGRRLRTNTYYKVSLRRRRETSGIKRDFGEKILLM